ncbi:hypothetical protein GOBAR_DD22821 [Gossypium barbadense]|nr:hypothetical protein GOBAR_DD22821 [Gossypium barbadense]
MSDHSRHEEEDSLDLHQPMRPDVQAPAAAANSERADFMQSRAIPQAPAFDWWSKKPYLEVYRKFGSEDFKGLKGNDPSAAEY